MYDGTRSLPSLQLLGVESEYIEYIKFQDYDRVNRERFELIDGIRDGRIRVINNGTGAHYLNYQEGTDQDDALFGRGDAQLLGRQ